MNSNKSWHSVSSYTWLVQISVLIYLIVLFGRNSARGIDITDDSYYILSAANPADTTAAVTQFGHYTNLLYDLAGGDIGNFRFFGVVLLLALSGLFAVSLQSYLKAVGFRSVDQVNVDRIMFFTLVSASLSYYCIWLITPSYNWLALIGCILVVTGILRSAINNKGDMYLLPLFSPLLIGAGGSIAFLAKPTTAIGLAIVFLFSPIALEYKRSIYRVALWSLLFCLVFFIAHILVFEDGFYQFIDEYRKGLALTAVHSGEYGISDILLNAKKGLSRIPDFIKQNIPASMLLMIVAIPVLYLLKSKIRNEKVLENSLLIYFVVVASLSWLELLQRDKWVGGDNVGTYLAYPMLSLTIVILLICFIVAIVYSDRFSMKNNMHGIFTLYGFCLLLLLASMAFSLGSNLGLVRRMSFAFIFIAPIIMVCAQWIDIKLKKSVAISVLSLLVSATTLLVINTAVSNPQRLPESIERQTHAAAFFDDKENMILADRATKQYITELVKVAREGGWKRGDYLIDLTGGSPGAAVILSARAPVTPWLIGGYPGSNGFVYKALSLASKEILSDSWLLTSAEGGRRIDLSVLDKLNLSFPENYIRLGVITTGYRNEEQILWRPR